MTAKTDSGTNWLDDMIRERLRNDFAAKSMQAVIGQVHRAANTVKDEKDISIVAYQIADAIISRLEKNNDKQ